MRNSVRDTIGFRSSGDFVWKDGERLIAYGESALASLPAFLRAAKMEQFVLIGTDRSLAQIRPHDTDGKLSAALDTEKIGAGRVADLAAGLVDQVGDHPVVAVGGGRAIDVAKAVAAANGQQVAAIPTTLSGAPMTGFHQLPGGSAKSAKPIRPLVVIANPELMASQPDRLLMGSAMNALSHAIESALVTTSSPVPRMSALSAIELIFGSLSTDSKGVPNRQSHLALGAIQAGYAVGATGYALHHVLCQTIVRLGEVPHAPTYGVMLPYTLEFYKVRDGLTWQLIAESMGVEDPSIAIAKVCAAIGNPTSLTELGVAPERLDAIVGAAAERPELRLTPGGATAEDIRSLLESAF